MLFLPDEFKKKELIFDRAVFEIIINTYHVILIVTSFLACNFEKLIFYVLYVLLLLTRGHLRRETNISDHMRKFWTDLVAIFKLLSVCRWSPCSGKVLHLQRYVDISKQISGKKHTLVYVVQIFCEPDNVN